MALAGQTTNDASDIRKRIRRELERKFAGAASPELLSQLDTLPRGVPVAYTYLFKDLPFEWAFERWRHGGLMFAGREVETFGIGQFLESQENEARAARQVLVYDYRSADDFILELKTRSDSDHLILAKIPPAATLAGTVAAVQNRLRDGRPGSMQTCSNLFIPVIDFDVLRNYSELPRGPLVIAVQQIRFRLDERGAVLKSEAVSATGRLQDLVFDKPFLVMILHADASQPYFAMWVANTELLVPSQVQEQP